MSELLICRAAIRQLTCAVVLLLGWVWSHHLFFCLSFLLANIWPSQLLFVSGFNSPVFLAEKVHLGAHQWDIRVKDFVMYLKVMASSSP